MKTSKVKTALAVKLAEINYQGIEEKTYNNEHPEILKWTNYFHSKVNKLNIFTNFKEKVGSSEKVAKVVGVQWYQFSRFMPWLLCRAAALMSTNEKRHYVIQTAFEELGKRKNHTLKILRLGRWNY